VRIFKDEAVLEVWMKRDAAYEKFDSFPICYFSGTLGPKQAEGDFQAPEGFYEVGARQLNPHSAYHLAFNLGYPNAYDRGLKRTGSALMVHGKCASVGCYAMTDYGITEIYALVAGALKAGQRSVPVHIFPFRMTDAAMGAAAGHGFLPFWENLKEGYDAFEATHLPPAVYACGERYAFGAGGTSSCARVAAW
jgi:murein L,D-transpeptidase YafK